MKICRSMRSRESISTCMHFIHKNALHSFLSFLFLLLRCLTVSISVYLNPSISIFLSLSLYIYICIYIYIYIYMCVCVCMCVCVGSPGYSYEPVSIFYTNIMNAYQQVIKKFQDVSRNDLKIRPNNNMIWAKLITDFGFGWLVGWVLMAYQPL